jgi:CheY-like chemotaxis protein
VVPEEVLALALGATQCLRKPIQRERFLQALQAAVQPPA